MPALHGVPVGPASSIGGVAVQATAVVEPGTLSRALLSFARDGTDEKKLAARICQACVEGLDVDGASISLQTASVARQTLWATDPVAEQLEDLEFTLNEGVGMEAASTGYPVLVPALQHGVEAARWPIFAAAVREQTNVQALFALPLQWGAANVGVLDLYRLAPGPLRSDQLQDLLSAVDTATLMLLGQRTDPGDGAGAWLDHALTHRAEVHQATGMVLVQLAVSPADALARMRAHAFVHQRPLIDVARDVVQRRIVFSEDAT